MLILILNQINLINSAGILTLTPKLGKEKKSASKKIKKIVAKGTAKKQQSLVLNPVISPVSSPTPSQTQTSAPVSTPQPTPAPAPALVQPTTTLQLPTSTQIPINIINNSSNTIAITYFAIFPGAMYYGDLSNAQICDLYGFNTTVSCDSNSDCSQNEYCTQNNQCTMTLANGNTWYGAYSCGSNDKYLSGYFEYQINNSSYTSPIFLINNQDQLIIDFGSDNVLRIFSQNYNTISSCKTNNSCGKPVTCNNSSTNPQTTTGGCGCSNFPSGTSYSGTCSLNWNSTYSSPVT